MKKTTFFLVLFFVTLLSVNVTAQRDQKSPITYTFINEYGFYLGGYSGQPTPGLTGVFINGVKFNNGQDVLGIGIGYESDELADQSIPVFLNFRHIFPSNVKLKPVVNFAIGTRFSYWEEDQIIGYDPVYLYPIYGSPIQKSAFGIYSTIAAGFNVNAFSFTSGFFFKSVGKKFYGGIEVKCGFTL